MEPPHQQPANRQPANRQPANRQPANRRDATGLRFRELEPADDPRIASIIRDVLTEHGCTGPGYAIHDAELESMSAAYPGGDASYLVVELEGLVLGGGGFGPLAGTRREDGIAELRKMYFLPELRGLGAGGRLLTELLQRMRTRGYVQCYLETDPVLETACRLYESFGFERLDGSRGATGHDACERHYQLDL